MRRHQHAAFLRHRSEHGAGVVRHAGDLGGVGRTGLVIGAGAGGIACLQRVPDDEHDVLPQVRIHPDVRVEAVLVVLVRQQPVARQRLAGEHDGLRAADLLERVLELRLEVQAVGDDHVRRKHPGRVGAGRLVDVRIDALSQEGGDRDPGSADGARGVAEHRGRGQDRQRPGLREGGRGKGGGRKDGEGAAQQAPAARGHGGGRGWLRRSRHSPVKGGRATSFAVETQLHLECGPIPRGVNSRPSRRGDVSAAAVPCPTGRRRTPCGRRCSAAGPAMRPDAGRLPSPHPCRAAAGTSPRRR